MRMEIVPIDAAQIVHDIAAAEDKDPAFAKRLNLAPEFQVPFQIATLIQA